MVLVPAKGTFLFCLFVFAAGRGFAHCGWQWCLPSWGTIPQNMVQEVSRCLHHFFSGRWVPKHKHPPLFFSHLIMRKMVNQSVSPPGNVQLSSQGHFVKLSLVCLGVWLYHSPFPCTNLEWVGVCVPTERHGQVFKDMGFMVHEHSFWNPNKLCIDPNLIFSVVEVQRSPAQNLVLQLGLCFYFPFFYSLETSKTPRHFLDTGLLALSQNEHRESLFLPIPRALHHSVGEVPRRWMHFSAECPTWLHLCVRELWQQHNDTGSVD